MKRRRIRMKIKVAAVQMETTHDREKNIEMVVSFIDRAGQMGVKLICFHEYLITECPEDKDTKEELFKKAEPIPGPFTHIIGERAKKYQMYVIPGTLFELEGGKLYNTSPLIGPDGLLIGKFRKMHPENAWAKHEIGCGITPGDGYPLFNTELGKIGIMIDMDGTVPMVPEVYSLQAAEILCWPINWSARWYRTVRILSQAHGIMSKCHILSSNRVGLRRHPRGDLVYSGGAEITDPEGNVIAAVSDFYEGLAVAEIDLEFTRRWRKEVIPRDYPVRRRPGTYTMVTNT
jgi:predicted amidohydrolase